MVILRSILALAGILIFMQAAGADPHRYIQGGLGDVTAYCTNISAATFSLSGIGGGCIFPVSHVQPNAYNQASLGISDSLDQPTSGTYCQDNNGDNLCGGPGDPKRDFCSSITITKNVDWFLSRPIVVRVHGPANGVGTFSPCNDSPMDGTSMGSVGEITHT